MKKANNHREKSIMYDVTIFTRTSNKSLTKIQLPSVNVGDFIIIGESKVEVTKVLRCGRSSIAYID